MDVGHYMGVHKTPSDKWLLYDDDKVPREVTWAYVMSLRQLAYLLVYDAVPARYGLLLHAYHVTD